MKLSPHFWLSEFTDSQIAKRSGLSNAPSDEIIDNLRHVASQLEEVRMLLGGVPIIISSGYRAPMVNSIARGAKNSAHLRGLAADFTAPAFGIPSRIVAKIAASSINFDQCIVEFDDWVHIAFPLPGQKGRREHFRIG